MSMVKWTLFNELDPVEQQMRRLLAQTGLTTGTLPATDIYETADEYVVAIDVPGFEQEELAVELADHTLAVKGRRKKPRGENSKEFALKERLEREFERRFTLPITADTEHATAIFAKGVLEIHTPKIGLTEPRKVAISTG